MPARRNALVRRRTCAGMLFFVGFGRDWLEIFGLEDLPAIEAFDVFDAIAAGDHHGLLVFTGGLHIKRLG